MGRTDFSDQFRKIIIRHKRFCYDLNVIPQSACLVINPWVCLTVLPDWETWFTSVAFFSWIKMFS